MPLKLFRMLFVTLTLGLLVAGCTSAERAVDETYQAYYQACDQSKYGTASNFLSDAARTKAEQIGICGFVHETINLIELARGGPQHTFLEDPLVTAGEDTARIMWIDDQGYIAIVLFVKIDGEWLIDDIIWST